ncbi:MAG: DUF1116 domain-containing protein [Candidatus Dormibacteraeota bacterium]|nr:DUF1116 domain-containing protein [Candidatus Dormibacteraeota bacterium]
MSTNGVPLLDEPQAIVTAGLALFDETLAAQAVPVTAVQWQPPASGSEDALSAIADDARTPDANAEAVRRLTSARPYWVDIARAGDVLELGKGEFLHAGPPIEWKDALGPLRGALLGAMMYEGLATTVAEAEGIAAGGGIALSPCHSRGAVGPMAGVISASMPVVVLAEQEFGGTAYATLNEGLGKVLRYGAYDDEVIDRLRWLERVLAPLLREAVRRHGPVDLTSLIAQALQMGDEGHNRNRAGTSLLIREIVADLVEVDAPAADIASALRFINSNDHFFLNFSMPTGKAAADAARDIPGSTMVVAMARNGTEFGVQTSGTGDAWFTAPAPMVKGLYLGGFGPEDASPDLGDSTITETVGLGGFAMAAAPAIARFVGGEAADALRHTLSMYEITLAEHPMYQIPVLGFRGTPTGIDVTLVARSGVVPVVNTGIAGRVAGVGQVGAGLVEPPMQVFVDAVNALGRKAAAAT